MNKIFGISLAAILTAVPVVANAANGEVIPGDPGATAENAPLASSAAGYSLAVEDGKEDMMVTAGYVMLGMSKVHTMRQSKQLTECLMIQQLLWTANKTQFLI